MEDISGCGAPISLSISSRFSDDKTSDSGFISHGGSGSSSNGSGCSVSSDERSGSRSSALSSVDESSPSSSTSQAPSSYFSAKSVNELNISGSGVLTAGRYYHHSSVAGSSSLNNIRVWRDPNLFLFSNPIRHIDSVQHQSLMSYPAVAAGSPLSSSSTAASPSSVVAASSTPSGHYPPSSMIAPHALHHQLPAPSIYSSIPGILWKQQQFAGIPIAPAHMHPVAKELLDRERMYAHDRDHLREREQEREIEKQEREREKKHQQERERQEISRLGEQPPEQAVHEHFTESFKLAQKKWNLAPIGSSTRAANEEERKRLALEQDQRRLVRPELREREKVTSLATFSPYAAHNVQLQKTTPSNNKNDYMANMAATAVIQNRANPVKTQMSLPKTDSGFMYGYPGYQSINFSDKLKIEQPKNSVSNVVINSLTNPKCSSFVDRERELLIASGVPLTHTVQPSDVKNSVIVKNDGKNLSQQSQHVLPTTDQTPKQSIPAHSSSPKLRGGETHYLQPVKSYEYRSPSQSPLQASHVRNSTSPLQLHTDVKLHQHRVQNTSTSSVHQRQSPLPPTHHRQSPHRRQSPLPATQQNTTQLSHHRHSPHSSIQTSSSPEQRYGAPPGVTYQKAPVTSVGSYPYATQIPSLHSVTASTPPTKPKVGSPAPPQVYGKPTSGITSGTPICRASDININSVPLVSKALITPPSPYQQLSRLQLPPNAEVTAPSNIAPPPAHTSRSSSVFNDLRLSSQSVAPQTEPNNFISQVQPLDLGVKETSLISSAVTNIVAPSTIATTVSIAATELTKRKWETDSNEEEVFKKVCLDPPVLDRVTDLSPLIANAPTTIPTAVNITVNTPSLSTLPEENNTAPPVPCTSPNTPAKLGPSVVDSEKSNSPKPPSYGGHKVKKAWLQRHSGEDLFEDKSMMVNSNIVIKTSNGSLSINDNDGNVPTNLNNTTNMVTIATNDNYNNSNCNSSSNNGQDNSLSTPTVTKETDNSNCNGVSSALTSLNNSLSNIGSMAVNSINKQRPQKGGTKKSSKDNRSSPVILNGHISPKIAIANSDESSSSDTETTTKSSPKRVPPKVKRKKYPPSRKVQSENEEIKRKKLNSTSSTDSDKESASEKDSDNSSGKKAPSSGRDDKRDNSRKRGRRPKVSGSSYSPGNKQDSGGSGASSSNNNDAPKEKKFRDEQKDQKDPFPKPPVSQLKKTGESFLQDGPCFEVAPKLAKCRECRWTPNQRSRNNSNIFCRFYAFRRLRYTKNGQLAIAGFSDPHRDAKEDDLNLWLPNTKNPPTDLDLEMARFMLAQVGDQFCDLLTQEAEAIDIHISEDKKIAWKRVVQGVREMCDVCETTLFNFHWACSKCGFVVCIDCYKGRKNGTIKIWGECGKDRDDLSWLLCTNRQPHEQEKLMLTQIIAGDSLMTLAKMSHESRSMWDIPMFCGCALTTTFASHSNGICKEILRNLKQEKQKRHEHNGQAKTINGLEPNTESGSSGSNNTGKKSENDSPLKVLADVALSNQSKTSTDKTSMDEEMDSSSDSDDGNFSTLRELLIRPASKANGNCSQPNSPGSVQISANSNSSSTKPKNSKLEVLDKVISTICEDERDNTDDYLTDRFVNGSNNSAELKFFRRKYNEKSYAHGDQIPIRIMTLSESKLLYPDVPHSWLCDGKLLRLLDAVHEGNYEIFQDQWKRGQPVIVSDVTKRLDPNLWHPDSFIKDFGDIKNDLINCMTGNLVPNQQMRKFWEGFEYQSRRLKDEKGNGMLLKLKDWPPGEDFAEMLPSRYNDLMSVLPLGEYTQRNGKLNLASRLPDCFVRPDLGPKMYNAYGSAMYPNKGTTNLHLDISDAVNVMVYVGIPKDGDNEEHIKEAYRAIDEAGCDILTRRRVREKGELPGALWHIYSARDADKIRDLLNKVAIEKGARLEPNHDPIHDQSCYLDGPLRERLYKEYSVEGYAIVQCQGDAVFVPAGAPHQVRNLHNCIKVAEDFVSPENVSHCFHLTQEFRDLSDTHSNHEDKLQIKNIMYHAVKDSLSVLGAALLKSNIKTNNTEENCDIKAPKFESENE